MEATFWLDKWQHNEIGFDQPEVNPLLTRYWQTLALKKESKVLVPLCGKSIDMQWLIEQDYDVAGIELSRLAVTQFFEERGWPYQITGANNDCFSYADNSDNPYPKRQLHLYCQDIFQVTEEVFASCDAVYDRAALIALPEAMRRSYAELLMTKLPQHAKLLVITIEYEAGNHGGPPFSVYAKDIETLFGDALSVQSLGSYEEIFKGCEAINRAYLLTRK